MVRFSDMLGNGDDAQARPPVTAPLPKPPAPEPPVAEQPAPEDESPEEVLDRLAQYALEHSGESVDPEPVAESDTDTEPVPAEPAPAPLAQAAAGDDLLPRGKRRKRR